MTSICFYQNEAIWRKSGVPKSVLPFQEGTFFFLRTNCQEDSCKLLWEMSFQQNRAPTSSVLCTFSKSSSLHPEALLQKKMVGDRSKGSVWFLMPGYFEIGHTGYYMTNACEMLSIFRVGTLVCENLGTLRLSHICVLLTRYLAGGMRWNRRCIHQS